MVGESPGRLRFIATPSGFDFARQIEKHIAQTYLPRRGVSLTRSLITPVSFSRFGNSECTIEIEEHIRGDRMYIIGDTDSHATLAPRDKRGEERGYITQISSEGLKLIRDKQEIRGTETKFSSDDNFAQVVRAAEAARNALKGTGSITVVLPCFPSARQDKRNGKRASLDLKIKLNQLANVGVTHVLPLDIHTPGIDLAVPDTMVLDPLRASHTLMRFIESRYDTSNLYFGGPDVSAVTTAKLYGEKFGVPFGAVYKQRDYKDVNALKPRLGFLGRIEDFEGRDCIIVDDLIDTAGSVCESAQFFMTNGAKSARVMATHGVFSYPALTRLDAAYERGDITEVIVTNSIAHATRFNRRPWLQHVDTSEYYAKVIDALSHNESISALVAESYKPTPQ